MPEQVCNFKLLQKSYIDELETTGYIYEHEITGAHLVHLPCSDNNKVFLARFATQPQDDSGVAHIVEHCVLNGSEKYRLREPFVNLLKSSLNTFLNAMTFPHMTMYPVASLNEQDLHNLVDVYLDAVFHPLLHENELVFLQEGWHLALDETGEPVFNGVVFNEMKAQNYQPRYRLDKMMNRALFDNFLANNSGGDPKAMVDLTYEQFKAFHQEFYHPSNCVFYLYGDADLEPFVEQIEESIKGFERVARHSEVPRSKVKVEPQYLADTFDSTEEVGQGLIAWRVDIPAKDQIAHEMALQVALKALAGKDSSPLLRKLLAMGLVSDCYTGTDDYRLQDVLWISFKGLNEFEPEVLERKVLKAIDEVFAEFSPEQWQEFFTATINSLHFTLSEADSGNSPVGLLYAIDMLSYLSQDDPFKSLRFETAIAEVKRLNESGALLTLLKDALAHKSRVTICLKPDPEHNQRLADAEKLKASQRWHGLSKAEQEHLRDMKERLIEYQSTPDSKEQIATLPMLSLQDVSKKNNLQAVKTDSLQLADRNVTVWHYPVFTKHITYLTLAFDLAHITQEDLFYVDMLQNLLSSVDTAEHDFTALNNLLDTYIGSLKLSVDIDSNTQRASVVIHTLNENLQISLDLVWEILQKSLLNDKQRVLENLQSEYVVLPQTVTSVGHVMAMQAAQASFSLNSTLTEQLSGISYVRKLGELIKRLSSAETGEQAWQELQQKLVDLYQQIFARDNLHVELIGEEAELEQIKQVLPQYIAKLPMLGERAKAERYCLASENIAYVVPSQVQYCALAGYWQNLNSVAQTRELGEKSGINNPQLKGQATVLQNILSTEYLWNTVRMKGGAYGAVVGFLNAGICRMVSYRDPNIGKTYENYFGVKSYIESLNLDQAELESLILGSVSVLDQPRSARSMGELMLEYYDAGIDLEDLQAVRDGLLGTTVADLKKLAAGINLQDGVKVVIGNREQIAKESEHFTQIIEVF